MSVTISEEARLALVDFYREALAELSAAIVSSSVLDSERPRLTALAQESNKVLRRLDEQASKWAQEEITKVYRGNLWFVDGQIRSRGLSRRFVLEEGRFAKVHEEIIQDLVTNPRTGLGPRLGAVTRKMRDDVRSFSSSARLLKRQIRTVQSELAKGTLRGASPRTVRDQILESISGERTETWLALQRFQGTGAGGALETLANAPWLLKSNGARIHLFDHVQTLVQTHESASRNRARSERLVERGVELAQISPNPPLTPDACAIYAGRIVALTEEGAEETGYPYVGRLPNGGPPFHPNCTHTLRGWFHEFESDEDREIAERDGLGEGEVEKGGIPKSYLDKSWRDVQKDVRRVGFDKVVRQNPQVASATVPSSAQEEVRQAIRSERSRRKAK